MHLCVHTLTVLILDADSKHSQDVERVKLLHGVDFLVENRLHVSGCGENV